MHRETKIGIIVMVIGICIPLMALPFVTGFSKSKGIVDNIYDPAIKIRDDTPPEARIQPLGNDEPKKNWLSIDFSRIVPKRIPWRFFLAATLICFYIAIVRIERGWRATKSLANVGEAVESPEDQQRESPREATERHSEKKD